MCPVRKPAKQRLKNNTENIVKCHYDADKQRDKRKASAGSFNIFALSLHKIKQERIFGGKPLAQTGYKNRIRQLFA